MGHSISKSDLISAKIVLVYWQRKYAYRLLIPSVKVPTRDMLPTIWGVGNRSTQPGEIFKKDER